MISNIIVAHSLQYFRHLTRRKGHKLDKVIMQGSVEGRQKPGQPMPRWFSLNKLLGDPFKLLCLLPFFHSYKYISLCFILVGLDYNFCLLVGYFLILTHSAFFLFEHVSLLLSNVFNFFL